ncbi:sensor histidine kinase [Fulvivirga sediminis]|uniref:histidine kinase n=1 Tax=Fulvivirga sediminis TaxID=2803949 RepID=A0A937F6Q4_9BACT|nr:ATP-binding protein [Fulvivirga sediminis]MBL3657452.1 PAS domain-containing protein [Fulvivirga sediminis]
MTKGKEEIGVDTALRSFLKTLSIYLIYFVITLGLIVLIGWGFDVEFIKRPISGLVAMNPLTAFCFVLYGAALFWQERKMLTRTLSLLLILISSLHIVFYLTNFHFQVDEVLFNKSLLIEGEGKISNRMALNTAFCFMLSGFIVVGKSFKLNSFYYQILAVMLFYFANFSLIGYAYGVKEFYDLLSYFPMAVHTAIGFAAASLAILFNTCNIGIMRDVTTSLSGGKIARIIMPLSVGLTFFAGLLAEMLQLKYRTSEELGIALAAMLIIVSNTMFIWLAIIKINKKDRAHRIAESKVRWTDSLLRSSIDSLRDISIISVDKNLRCISYNKSFAKSIKGIYNKEVDIGRPLSEIISLPEHYEDLREKMSSVLAGEVITEEKYLKSEDMWFELRYRAIYDHNKDIVGVTLLSSNATYRKVKEAQLESANKELEAFSYTVAHDLRAPLRIIDGYLSMLKEDLHDLDNESQRLMNIISNNAIKMGVLIDELLNFAKLGRRDIQLKDIDTCPLVEEVLSEQISVAENKNIDVKLGNLENMKGDPGLMKQVFSNLISNSLKYSKNKIEIIIEINSFRSDEEITFCVKDNGVGFDMEYSGKLFGVFQRLHKESEFEGTGVGLATVERIIKKHGGKIWAESEIDKGTTFYFTIPTETKNVKQRWTLN